MKLLLTTDDGNVVREWSHEEIVDLDMRTMEKHKLAADIAMEINEGNHNGSKE